MSAIQFARALAAHRVNAVMRMCGSIGCPVHGRMLRRAVANHYALLSLGEAWVAYEMRGGELVPCATTEIAPARVAA